MWSIEFGVRRLMAAWPSAFRRFVYSALLAASFFVAVIFLLVSNQRNAAVRRHAPEVVAAAENDVIRMMVIEAERRRRSCGPPLEVATEAEAEREICRPLLQWGNWSYLVKPSPPLSTPAPRRPLPTSADLVRLATSDCECFRSRLGYFTEADTTPEERAFPLAFSLLTYENLQQTERLLRLIYRPHNAYCVHVDRKSDGAMHDGVEALAACLPNVLVARPAVNVTWGEISVVRAELLCVERLLAHSDVPWRYFMNVVARDMPLRTNAELVQILTAYNGANDIDGTRKV